MRKRIAATITVVLLMLSCLSTCAFADSFGSADKARNSVARVVITGNLYVVNEKGNTINTYQNVELSHGSCFAVGEKGKPVSYFVTNRHVISKQATAELFTIDGNEILAIVEPIDYYVVMDNEGNRHPADLVTDNAGGADLAVLMLREPTTKREAIYLSPYTDATKVRNQTVYSVGFPGSSEVFLDQKQAYSSSPDLVSVRQGQLDHEVTAVQSGGQGTLLLTDAPMSGGNSGGPLVDAKGAVLGVCTSGANADANMNAAISVNEVVALLSRSGIPYMTADSVFNWLTIALIALAAVLAIAVIVLLLKKSGGKKSKNSKSKSPYRLQGLSGVYAGKRYPIEGNVRIGRDSARNDLVYPQSEKKISSVHCVISQKGQDIYIQDCGSTNGTFINDQRVEPGQTRRLLVGDIITLADRQNSFKIDVSNSKK